MQKQIFILSLLLFFGVGVLCAQPKAVGEPRVIAKTDEPLQRPAWSDDGAKLSFNYGQWEISANGSNLQRVEKSSGLLKKSVNNAVLQQMIDQPTKAASQLKGLESLNGYMIYNPVLSPKGDQIVFQATRHAGMFVCNADGSGLRHFSVQGERATWTADGKYVVAQIEGNDGHVITSGELIAIEVATGATSSFFASDQYITLSPAISPDGKKIAFEDHATGAIYVMDVIQ